MGPFVAGNISCGPIMEGCPLVCAVDDDPGLCESLDALLRSAGFAVRTFSSAEEFLRSSASHEAHCLVLDYAMPGMSGLELRRALLDRGNAVPVIFATAVGREDVWNQLAACGAFAVLPKPVDAEALLDAVQRALSERRSP
jgi:FixJ family two-component response regulator